MERLALRRLLLLAGAVGREVRPCPSVPAARVAGAAMLRRSEGVGTWPKGQLWILWLRHRPCWAELVFAEPPCSICFLLGVFFFSGFVCGVAAPLPCSAVALFSTAFPSARGPDAALETHWSHPISFIFLRFTDIETTSFAIFQSNLDLPFTEMRWDGTLSPVGLAETCTLVVTARLVPWNRPM